MNTSDPSQQMENSLEDVDLKGKENSRMENRYGIRILVVWILLLLSQGYVLAQHTIVSGRVTDGSNGEPVPFASVYFKGTTIGVTTDINGQYELETGKRIDSLSVSFIGYLTTTYEVKRGETQVLDFILEQDAVTLSGITVVPEEDLVDLMMNWVRNHREANDARNKLDYYQYKAYNKIQIDANNVTDKFFDRSLMRPFDFVKDYVDTSDYTSKAYLPVLFSETNSEKYYRQNPSQEKEVIVGARVSGIENESITQFLGSVYQKVNVYDNYIFIFDKNFVSPIAGFSDWFYEYDLVDTVLMDNKWCFEVTFKPKRKQEMLFYGSMFIHDSSYAVKKISMWMDKDVNLNFINNVMIDQEFDLLNGRYWMITRDFMMADFNPLKGQKNTLGFTGRRTSINNEFTFNQAMEDQFYAKPDEVIVEKSSRQHTDEYWDTIRPEELSGQEEGVYEMVDSVKNLPAFKNYFNFSYFLTRGYWKLNKVELGPWWKAVTTNNIEGLRVRVGGRTTKDFHDRLQLDGYLAYGFKDKRFKYGANALYLFSKVNRRALHLSFKDDLEQLGKSADAFAEDNILAALFRRNPANSLTFTREYSVGYEHDWFAGFSNTLRFAHRQVFPLGDTRFVIYGDNEYTALKKSIITGEIQLLTRYVHREKYIYNNFERRSISSHFPVLELLYGYGVPGFLGGEYEYHRLQFRIKHWFNLFTFGWSKYIIETGKIWGTLPYPQLKLHEGNETFLFVESAFNLMNYYEFISDTYVSAYYTHHFDGLIFNKIPLMRKLKWRTVVHGRGAMGSLTDENKAYSEFPENSNSLEKPYFEAGIGIENIFKVLRVDGIWRLSHLDHPNADKFRIYVSLNISL